MEISLSVLAQCGVVDKLIYHAHAPRLYMVSAIVAGKEHHLCSTKGVLLQSSKLSALQKSLGFITAKEIVLRQTSAYDEMVGGADKGISNTLEVVLTNPPFLKNWGIF
tara:strand:+ start:66 stop:389 length:324 start_codon:yes stop_codon:yes gene_type:complete